MGKVRSGPCVCCRVCHHPKQYFLELSDVWSNEQMHQCPICIFLCIPGTQSPDYANTFLKFSYILLLLLCFSLIYNNLLNRCIFQDTHLWSVFPLTAKQLSLHRLLHQLGSKYVPQNI